MFARVAILIVVTAFLAGCGNKPSGIYHAANPDRINLFTKLDFTSGSKLELTGMDGSITEATYVEDGDGPKVTAEGETQMFTINKDGSIDGGLGMGRFVKL